MESPSVLYKYMTDEVARIVLESARLRWSSPELFNDPAEFQRLPVFDPPLTEAIKALPQVIFDAASGATSIDEERLSGPTRHMLELTKFGLANGVARETFLEGPADTRELDRIYHEVLRNHFGTAFTGHARVMCLTANPSNPAMWANYAGKHSGCLLGFRHLPEKSTPFTEARPVSYVTEPPVLCSGIDFLLYCDKLGLGQRSIEAICYSKRSEWSYEQEWRVITWRADENEARFGDYPFLPEELESITFGLSASPLVQENLSALAISRFPACDVYRIEHLHGELLRRQVPSPERARR